MRKRPQVVPTEARPSGGIYSSLYYWSNLHIWSKKYKIADTIIAVSPCVVWNKNFFQISNFCSALPSLLVEKFTQLKTQHSKYKTNIAIVFGRKIADILPILSATEGTESEEKYQIINFNSQS